MKTAVFRSILWWFDLLTGRNSGGALGCNKIDEDVQDEERILYY